MGNKRKKISQFFGVNSSMLSMLIMVVLLGMGEKMGERFLPVYLVAIGGSTFTVGLLNAMDNFLSAIYSFIGGYVSDRLGYKKALMVYSGISIIGYLIIILVPTWQAVLFGAVFFISWTALSLPAILSLVSATVKAEKQIMGVSLHSLTRRVPMALGPVFGGIFISLYGVHTGARIAFSIALVFAFVSFWVIHRFIEDRKDSQSEPPRIKETLTKMSPELKVLLVSDIFVRFAEQIPYAFVVLWIMNVNHLSAVDFGLLTVIEMVVAMMIYIPVAYLSEKTSSKFTVAITFGFFTIFPLVLLFSKSMPMLILAFIIRGLKEFGEPTRKALIVRLAPEGGKASTFGTYYLLRDIVVSVVSLSSAYLWNIAPAANFVTASCLGGIGTLIFILFGSSENKTRESEAMKS